MKNKIKVQIPENTTAKQYIENGFAVTEFVPEEVSVDVFKWYEELDTKTYWLILPDAKAVGFVGDKWIELNESFPDLSKLKPADMNEVKKLLIQEAEKKGYKKDVKIKSTINNDEYVLNNWGYSMNTFRKGDLALGGAHIFNGKTGKWAEIVKEPLYINQYGTEFFEGDEFFNVRLIDLNPIRFRSNPKKGDKNWSEALTERECHRWIYENWEKYV